MELSFTVQTKVQKPVADVFDAVYNPDKIKSYFALGGSSGPLDPGTTVIWNFSDYNAEVPVTVTAMEKNKRIAFEWGANEIGEPGAKKGPTYNTAVELVFEKISENETMVRITESGWKESQNALKGSYQNCSGWTQMATCLKAWLEHGINVRSGCEHS